MYRIHLTEQVNGVCKVFLPGRKQADIGQELGNDQGKPFIYKRAARDDQEEGISSDFPAICFGGVCCLVVVQRIDDHRGNELVGPYHSIVSSQQSTGAYECGKDKKTHAAGQTRYRRMIPARP